MTKTRPERPDEIRAREIVCAAIGAAWELLDRHPLQGVCDYRLHVAGQPAGVLEVTTHGDPLRMNLGKQTDRGGWSRPSSRLHHFWSVHLPRIEKWETRSPYRYADVIDDMPQLEDLLDGLESVGVLEVGRWSERPLFERLRALGVESARGMRTGEPGIHVLPPGNGGGSGPGAVTGAAESEAAKEDNRRKLAKGPYPEGEQETERPFPAHLFVWISPERVIPLLALADRVPPTPPASVPEEISDLWVAGDLRSGELV